MKRDGSLERHDFTHSDRVREDIFAEIQQPGGLFFVARRLMGHTRLNEKVHKPAAMFIESIIREPFGAGSFGDSRGQGKSTLCITIPFWMPLMPAVPGTPLRGLNSRLAYVAPKIDLARYVHLAKIRGLFDEASVYRELVGDIIQPRQDMWGLKEGLMWRGADVRGGRNVIPLGMETTSTTLHPIVLVVDDPITEQNYRSLSEISKILDWIDKSYNLIEPERGARLVTGNIWAKGDVQDTIGPNAPEEFKHLRNFKLFRRGLISCPECIDGTADLASHPSHIDESLDTEGLVATMLNTRPPELLDDGSEKEFVATLDDAHHTLNSVTRVNAMAQYLNRPIAIGTVQLDESQIKNWEPKYDSRGDYTIGVWAAHERAKTAVEAGDRRFAFIGPHWLELISLEALDVYILVDPAPSEEESKKHSRFSVAALGLEKGGPRIFLLDEYAKNAPPQRNYDAVLDLYLKWQRQYRRMGVESVGYQATIPRALVDRARVRGINLRIESIEKIPRIRAEGAQIDRIRYSLSGLFESGMFHARRDHYIFRGEVRQLGIAGTQHDLLDAISNGPIIWGPARTGDPTLAKLLARRGLQRRKAVDSTGY